jgi:predicted DNA-binding protein
MGRPPLKRNVETVVTTIRITAEMGVRIDAVAGTNKRSEFIREAIEAELDRREREALKS